MAAAYETRRFVIFDCSEIDKIDFNEVNETSAEALRKNVSGTKTFVKYDVMVVESTITETQINAETGEEMVVTTEAGVYGRPEIYSEEYPEYTHEAMLELLSTSEWTTPIENR